MKRKIAGTREEQLRAFPLFAGCSVEELAAVDNQGTEITVEPGEILVHEGNPGRQSFIIVSGRASVTAGGREIARLGTGDFFGEMAVLTLRPRSATVTAVTRMRVLVLEPRELATILKVSPVSHAMLRGVCDRLYAVEEQMA
jgi:CRP-like cAMP-binding protein